MSVFWFSIRNIILEIPYFFQNNYKSCFYDYSAIRKNSGFRLRFQSCSLPPSRHGRVGCNVWCDWLHFWIASNIPSFFSQIPMFLPIVLCASGIKSVEHCRFGFLGVTITDNNSWAILRNSQNTTFWGVYCELLKLFNKYCTS